MPPLVHPLEMDDTAGRRSPDSHSLLLDIKDLPSENGTLLALGTA